MCDLRSSTPAFFLSTMCSSFYSPRFAQDCTHAPPNLPNQHARHYRRPRKIIGFHHRFKPPPPQPPWIPCASRKLEHWMFLSVGYHSYVGSCFDLPAIGIRRLHSGHGHIQVHIVRIGVDPKELEPSRGVQKRQRQRPARLAT